MSRELLKRALDELLGQENGASINELVQDIETYLAHPEPELVAWRALNFAEHGGVYAYRDHDEPFVGVSGSNVGEPLYTTPPDQSARIADLTQHLKDAHAENAEFCQIIERQTKQLAALQVKCKPLGDEQNEATVGRAYIIADQMLKERERGK